MEYWWEGSASTAIPPTSASDIMGQQNKIEGITFSVALLVLFIKRLDLSRNQILPFIVAVNVIVYVTFNVFLLTESKNEQGSVTMLTVYFITWHIQYGYI